MGGAKRKRAVQGNSGAEKGARFLRTTHYAPLSTPHARPRLAIAAPAPHTAFVADTLLPAFASNPASGFGAPAPLPSERQRGYARLRRSTLVYLRWMAVVGQTLALAVVALGFGFAVPAMPAFLVVGASVVLNIVLMAARPLDRTVGNGETALQLGFDILQLGALLYLTGGLANPFAVLLLAPVVTAATTLSFRVMGGLALLVAGVAAALIVWSEPLPWMRGGELALPDTYRWGVWVALLVGIGFTSLYTWRAAAEARRMSAALAATELVLAKEQKMAALGGLAAAAAHELGTPLATIQVTAKEMARETAPDTHLGEDARLILDQARRCRDILTQLSSRGDDGDLVHDRFTLEELIQEAIEPHIDSNKSFVINVQGPAPFALGRPDPNITIPRRPELVHGLRNFIENAASFAEEEVAITAKTTLSAVTISISDDGPGFDPLVRARLGEPYVSSRPAGMRKKAGGMGLGVFIAKTLIERTGGRVRFSNLERGGALVTLYWPKAVLMRG